MFRIPMILSASRKNLADRTPAANVGGASRQVSHRRMPVLDARISNVRRYRSYHRIEALVDVTFQVHPSTPPQQRRLLTSVPIRSSAQSGDHRARLIESAMKLALLI